MERKYLIASITGILLFGGFAMLDSAFALPGQGCPVAHCDAENSDNANMAPPTGNVGVVWQQNSLAGEVAGSKKGLGCSGDGSRAVCTYAGTSDNVVAYDFDGNRLWTSGSFLNSTTFTSAPMLLDNGDTIVPDNTRVVKFDAFGSVVWNTVLPDGGVPISPVMTQDGVVVLATKLGPVYAIDEASGAVLASLFITDGPSDPGYFDTLNTPAVRGNRVYISTEHTIDGEIDEDNLAWLVALDVDGTAPNPADRLTVAWHFVFGAGSKSSPLAIDDVIYFDALRPGPGVDEDPHIFAVRDDGNSGSEVFRVDLQSEAFASFGRDPRPDAGFWHFRTNRKFVVRRSATTGEVLQYFNVDKLIREPGTHVPSSAMTIAGTPSNPVLIMSATAFRRASTYVIAVDLVTGSLVWKVLVSSNPFDLAAGQFPLLTNGTDVRAVFSSVKSGARAIGP